MQFYLVNIRPTLHHHSMPVNMSIRTLFNFTTHH